VGVNAEIVNDGVNGFLCEAMPLTNSVRWEKALTTLLTDHALRASFGAAGRTTIEKQYSVQSQAHQYQNLFGEKYKAKE
jgi:glycosyltransferase involved in cell wall biosynthesis